MRKKKDNRKMNISFFINNIISVLTINAIIMSIMGIKFMYGYEPSSEITGVPIYSYFTIQSNIFMGIVSFIFANREYQVLKGKKREVSRFFYILKYVATVSVSLTFFVVFAYLGFVTKGGHIPLIRNSNLFFHLIIPVVSILSFVFLEKTDVIKPRDALYAVIPTFLYELYYVSNILINMKNGKIIPSNDWYLIAKNGLLVSLIVAPAMLGITYLLSITIRKLNRKKIS